MVAATSPPLAVSSCGVQNDAGSGSRAAATTAETASHRGEFTAVPNAPTGIGRRVSGTAEETRKSRGATVSIRVSGLKPQTDYFAHVHTGSCGLPDPGGPHFKFDPNAGDLPPNEVHLHFTTDGSGNGADSTEVPKPLPDGQTLTVVVHQKGDEYTPAVKIACATLNA